MRRRASTAAGISAAGTRMEVEGTPAVTAASITAEAARPRLPVPSTHPLKDKLQAEKRRPQPALSRGARAVGSQAD